MGILEFINTNLNIDFGENNEMPFSVSKMNFAKGDVITKYGQIEKRAYFIIKGLVELAILQEGEEKIIDFFTPNNFFCSYTSFLIQKPSDVQITALVDCELEFVNHSDLQHAYKTSLIANQLGRLVTESIYITKTKREKDFLTKSAQERYMELFTERPEIIQQVPVRKIAKYLGIRPESLSRLRKTLLF
jgi:CRP-like cAMP-binding protein